MRRAPIVIACFALCAPALSAEPASVPSVGIVGVLVNLALVLALIGVCAWLYARANVRMRASAGSLAIVASRQVGSRERLAVVQVGDEQVLLGITSQGISHLHTLATPLTATDEASLATSPFAEKLRALGGAIKRDGEAGG